MDDEKSRCTPPVPPVTKNSRPHERARCIVDATVVLPHFVSASVPLEVFDIMYPSSLVVTLVALPSSPLLAKSSSSEGDRPTFIRPFLTAIVAGTQEEERIIDSTEEAVERF